ncbi:hypothetical protein [Lentibacillus sp. Marseille-P4043]|nr:hypothetical protein [Lentibacillus sp. Marseille-P4043]GLB61795.1 hypothetical protein NCCP133_39240 [Cytobacillus sp. NCCP-133]
MFYLDYISSYFCVVGLVWFLMILCGKYVPLVVTKGKEKTEKLQERIFLLSIPLSLALGYTLFHFFNLYEYMRLV